MSFRDLKLSLHEATVESFYWYNNSSLKLKLSYINVLDVTEYIVIDINQIQKLEIDGILVKDTNLDLYDDGEILDYEILNDRIRLIIEWNDFKSKLSKIKSYNIICKDIFVDVG